jgi:hypothetical protein
MIVGLNFGNLKENLILSTAPGFNTHWKQTLIPLPEEIEVFPGTEVETVISLKPSQENERYFNITLELSSNSNSNSNSNRTIKEDKENKKDDICQTIHEETFSSSFHNLDSCECAKCILIRALGLHQSDELNQEFLSSLFSSPQQFQK